MKRIISMGICLMLLSVVTFASEKVKQSDYFQRGAFFSVDCIINYELIRELMSFGKDLLVLTPESLKNQIIEKISANIQSYSILRT